MISFRSEEVCVHIQSGVNVYRTVKLPSVVRKTISPYTESGSIVPVMPCTRSPPFESENPEVEPDMDWTRLIGPFEGWQTM